MRATIPMFVDLRVVFFVNIISKVKYIFNNCYNG